MTPKEKADELYRWYIDYTFGYFNCKQCTLIAVDEILKIVNVWSALNMQKSSQVIFWEEVKKKIEAL